MLVAFSVFLLFTCCFSPYAFDLMFIIWFLFPGDGNLVSFDSILDMPVGRHDP